MSRKTDWIISLVMTLVRQLACFDLRRGENVSENERATGNELNLLN